jgi:NAD(P)-dependent dehydrogenase (short-subunit alcohol dehydrogenase family)
MSTSKTALITGGTRGIGFLTAERLSRLGYRVLLTGRSQTGADEAAAKIRSTVAGASIEGLALDLGSLRSVRALAESQANDERSLDVVIANAGVMERFPQVQRSADGLEMMFAANHLGHFLLTVLLLPRLLRSAPSRIVVVSSRWHAPGSSGPQVNFDFDNLDGSKSYDPTVFYKNSKLANLWFAFELARRLEGSGVTVNAVCPGFVPATLAEHQVGFQRLVTKYLLPMLPAAHSPADGADNTIFVATDPTYATRSGALVGERQEVEPSTLSRDRVQAERLWEVSCRLASVSTSGLTFTSPMAPRG